MTSAEHTAAAAVRAKAAEAAPRKPLDPVLAAFEALRPRQWIKNFFVLIPLGFTLDRWNRGTFTEAAIAFVSFCLVSGAIYIWNDWCDVEQDRLHPTKCRRPLASGRIGTTPALLLSFVCLAGGLALAFSVNKHLLAWIVAYAVLQVLYSKKLKHMVILDVMCLAAGFVLRVLAGGAAVNIPLSNWLLITSSLLALFLGFTKRRQEILQLAEDSKHHRAVLAEYNILFIDQMNSVLAGSCIVCYALYTVAPETTAKFHTNALFYTLPFVVYGILRYLHLIHLRQLGDNPTEVVLHDRGLQVCIALWLVTFLAILKLRP
jgi:4-hydroxybenzoate polyprenyltransferase